MDWLTHGHWLLKYVTGVKKSKVVRAQIIRYNRRSKHFATVNISDGHKFSTVTPTLGSIPLGRVRQYFNKLLSEDYNAICALIWSVFRRTTFFKKFQKKNYGKRYSRLSKKIFYFYFIFILFFIFLYGILHTKKKWSVCGVVRLEKSDGPTNGPLFSRTTSATLVVDWWFVIGWWIFTNHQIYQPSSDVLPTFLGPVILGGSGQE